MTDNQTLTFANHLERDPRMDGWSIYGLGEWSHTTEQWVNFVLSFELPTEIPEELREMFGRIQACMVYGCYHYPLFTMGSEEMYRFLETALKAAVRTAGASNRVLNGTFSDHIDWAARNSVICDEQVCCWRGALALRNRASHKDKNSTLPPNFSLSDLKMAKELTEAIFEASERVRRKRKADAQDNAPALGDDAGRNPG